MTDRLYNYIVAKDTKMPRRMARDQTQVDADFCLRITTAMLEKLGDQDPAEAERFRAGLAELIEAGTEEEDEMAPRGAQDSAGWRAAAHAAPPTGRVAAGAASAELAVQASRIRPAATGFLRRVPAARRIRLLG